LNPQCENYVDNLLTKEKEAINPNDLFWFHIAASIFIVIGGIGMFYGRVYDDLAVMAMSLATIISTAYVVWLVRD
jgi:hypothetical protein